MRRIINNKTYDTDTAKFVGSVGQELDDRLNRVEEDLYRKRTGEYFLHGSGGAMTRYGVALGDNNWSGGERIMPLSYEQARAWAEEELDVEEYEREFGVPVEAGEVQLGVRISDQAKSLLDRETSRSGESRSAIVERLIKDALS